MDSPKNIPGTKQLKNNLMDLKTELQKIIDSIKDISGKIEDTKRADAQNSPKAPLLAQRRTLNNEIKDLRASRREIFDQMKEIEDVYGDLGGKKEESRVSTDSIEKRLREINLEVMKFPHSSQKSKEIEDEIRQLKAKKINIESEQKKHEILKKAQEKFYSLKGSVREYNKEIAEKTSELQEINRSLEDLDAQETVVNPVIENFEKAIENLKAKKEDVQNKIKNIKEDLTKKREEFDKYLKMKATQEAYEKQKKAILDKIAELEERKEAFIAEQNSCDASKFDSVVFALNKFKAQSGTLSFPIDLVLSLTKFKVKIPSLSSQIPATISELETKKKDFLNTVTSRTKELEKKIAEVEDLIQQERNSIAAIPVVEIILPPFISKPRSK
ncbi:hypothetical protein NGRA_0944 [Nosema granulosis]|uniref:Uncharacterized protein n=1 Tax=Nosema granulosis TaxID=83296 RepID=A0A9P6GZD2_9MICR|nr:hypothetical protein NGRA_0944 [Nosema granulosis]